MLVLMYFCALIHVNIEGTIDVTLEDILQFCTGTSKVPPGGFHQKPVITFIHSSASVANASTCDLILRLPTVHHDNPCKFEEMLHLSLKGSLGFGKV